MYKVGYYGKFLIVYNSKIGSAKEAYNSYYHIGIVSQESITSVWHYTSFNIDTFNRTSGDEIHWKRSEGEEFGTLEEAFFRLQLALTEFGFEGIMELELPEEARDV